MTGAGARTHSGLAWLAAAGKTQAMPTPFPAIDLDVMDRNIALMQAFFHGKSARLRPHVKTHKSTAIARMQVDAGANGVTCSTTDEVAAMVAAGITDVLLANVVTDTIRLQSLAASAARADVMVAVDSLEAAELLSGAVSAAGARIGVVIDFDIGMGRNGVVGMDEAERLTAAVVRLPGLRLRGVMAYEGHLVDVDDREMRARKVTDAWSPALALYQHLQAHYDLDVLTGGATSTYDIVAAFPNFSDIQAGTYVLMDTTYHHLTPEFEPAVAVIASVQTVRPGERVVVNAGAKRLSTDWGAPSLVGYASDFVYTAEEHTVFQLTGGDAPSVGDRVAIIPGHACTTMSMYRMAAGCRNGALEKVLEIDARDPLA
jgi:D-serine deaminase-like pyridoxal phosphate-dependent protein